MSAEEHLSPGQFGFVHHDLFDDDHSQLSSAMHDLHNEGGRPGRINPSAELHSIQSSMYQDQVDFYRKNPQERAVTSRIATPVEIYHIGGKRFVGEGHHRIAAARADGAKSVRAVHFGT